uniref:Uncharacterized protein n=1 Tax=Oryctolagus cuniculus TaxID=9986 RepID=G1THE1_RABIT
MLKILRRVVICFHRKSQEPTQGQPGSLQGDTRLNTVQGSVTSLCGDCGLINESIHFSTDVTGNVPLRVGQKVAAVVEEDEISRRLKAINVDAISGNLIGSGLLPPRIRVLIACVTSVKKNGFCVNKKTYCSLDIVSEGFVPYKGDWLEVEYSIQPGSSKIRAHSAKPVNYKHVDEVICFHISFHFIFISASPSFSDNFKGLFHLFESQSDRGGGRHTQGDREKGVRERERERERERQRKRVGGESAIF